MAKAQSLKTKKLYVSILLSLCNCFYFVPMCHFVAVNCSCSIHRAVVLSPMNWATTNILLCNSLDTQLMKNPVAATEYLLSLIGIFYLYLCQFMALPDNIEYRFTEPKKRNVKYDKNKMGK